MNTLTCEEYTTAKEHGDYIAMNRLAHKGGIAGYDYTHGGIIAELPYECKTLSGILYLCQSQAIGRGTIKIKDQSIGTNDYIASDSRRSTDNPNVMIYNSYTASATQVTAIVDALLAYNKTQDPTDWAKTRTRNGLISEWIAHNGLWFLNIQRSSTADVDLDNNEYRFLR